MSRIRIGICALLAFAVLAHGGVENWARAIFEIGAGILFVLWSIRVATGRRSVVTVSPLLPPLALLSAFTFFQWALHVTASRYATRIELQLLLADLILLFLATQAFQSFDDWKSFVWFVMIFSFAVAIFGILQHFTFNGKIYWFRELRYGGVPFGPYVNRNHYAAFAELTIPVSLVPLVLGKVRRERLLLVVVLAVVPIGALLFCGSRGGVISFGCELLVLVVWLAARRAARVQALLGAATVGLALLLVSWLGTNQVLQRFSDLQTSEVPLGKRTAMARDTFHIFLDHRLLGTGLGTIQLVYPPYETLYDGKVVNHSHNDYLEALAETGVIGGLCCAWFLLALFWAAYRHLVLAPIGRNTAFQLAGFLGCVGFLAHSFVDFNLHIPANAFLFFLMAALCAADLPSASRSVSSRHDLEPVSAAENAD
jgi:O-antigen ligase